MATLMRLATATALVLASASDLAAQHFGIVIKSINSAGEQASGADSFNPSLSADGSILTFNSGATNLVDGDTNGERDVFVHDLAAGDTKRANLASDGTESNDESSPKSAISGDGRFVVFDSLADNLVQGDTNGFSDVFLRDRLSGETVRVSVHSNGTQGDGVSRDPAISEDGNVIAFVSYATNLIDGDTNGRPDIFVYDRLSRTTERVNIDSDGTQSDLGSDHFGLAPGGRHIAFIADDHFGLRDDGDGNCVDNVNTGTSVFLRDMTNDTTRLVAHHDLLGPQFQRPTVSADGRFVAFESTAPVDGETSPTTTRHILLHDLEGGSPTACKDRGSLTRVSVDSAGNAANDDSERPAISGDGRFVTFLSRATNLVADDSNGRSDVFLHDTRDGATRRLNVGADGAEANSLTFSPTISTSGRYVAFGSIATNLVPNDTNGSRRDIFVAQVLPDDPPPEPEIPAESIFTKIAHSSDPLVTNRFDPPVIDGDRVAFRGNYTGGGQVIYTGTGTADLEVVTEFGAPIPSRTGLTFEVLASPSIDQGNVAFGGGARISTAGVYSLQGGQLKRIADELTPTPENPFVLFKNGHVSTSAAVSTLTAFQATGDTGREGIYLGAPGEILPIAGDNDFVPGGNGRFRDFGAPLVDDGTGTLLFSAYDDVAKDEGLYLGIPFANPSVFEVVNSQTPLPGLGPDTQFSLNSVNMAIDDGYVLFQGTWQGTDGSRNTGLYLQVPGGDLVRVLAEAAAPADWPLQLDLDQGNLAFTSDRLQEVSLYLATGVLDDLTPPSITITPLKVVSTGDSIEGREVKSIGFGPGGLSGTALAFQATFTDGSEGVYVARPVVEPDSTSDTALATSVLPASRSAEVGMPATAFATVINIGTGTGEACTLGLDTEAPVVFAFQTTSAVDNSPTGSPNAPVDIEAGASQSYVISLTAVEPFDTRDVALRYDCQNGPPAASVVGLNTLQMSASDGPTADVVALGATPSGDGIINVPSAPGASGFGVVATVNVGGVSTGAGKVTADTGAVELPVNLFVCETDASGACMGGLDTEVQTSIAPGEQPTFAVFVQNSSADGSVQEVPFDPARNRVFVRVRDASGEVRGSTSMAIRTQ